MDPKQNEGSKTCLCYSREFLQKYDKYTLDPDIANLVNQLNNNWPRHTPKKMIQITVDSPSDSKSPGNRYPKSLPKKKNNNFEKNGKTTPLNTVKPLRLALPPGFSKSDLENDTVSRANSFPSVLNFNGSLFGDETPRKIASSPLISYADIFSNNIPMPFDPSLESYGESKFISLFSQPVSPDICGEINLKPYLSLDFIEDPPQPISPKTPNVKPLLSPKSHEATTTKSPFKNSKTPNSKSPRNRPVSPLDDQRLVQRQKQIDYGYRTVGYVRYRLLVSKEGRKPDHPRTPKKAQGCSKRSWDGQLKKWRRDLHLWDPDNLEAFRALLNSEVVETLVTANPELDDVVRAVREKLDNPNLKISDDDEDSFEDLSTSYSSKINPLVKSGEENQVISEPNNKPKAARTLIF
jgi:hypothetical protein